MVFHKRDVSNTKLKIQQVVVVLQLITVLVAQVIPFSKAIVVKSKDIKDGTYKATDRCPDNQR